MDKLPLPELALRLAKAKEFIPQGSKWRHYKGDEYAVIDLVLYEASSEVGVVYKPLANPIVTFVRPLVEWQDVLEHDGARVYRFRRLGI
ncbi:MAG TPA: DUF1653 domain-containing protein [Candidatus Saccharimonadales bacterium]|nr:DUF1653 domain-containing protein [Candidatus Saccharimonadales bacterium]